MFDAVWRSVRRFPPWVQVLLAIFVATTIIGWLRAAGWYLFFVAALLWAVALLGYLHRISRLGPLADFPALVSALDWVVKPRERLLPQGVAPSSAAPVQAAKAAYIDPDQLAATLKSKVIGQDEVCDELARTLRIRLAMAKRTQPLAKFLFAGPPGTGKTFLAKELAVALRRPLMHFDMTQFSDGHAASQLFGSPKGYVGSDSYGTLTGGLKKTPGAVILLDEIEKASPEVHKKFLTALNDGFVTESSTGEKIGTVDAVFIMTTNAGFEALGDLARDYKGRSEEMVGPARNILKEAGFAPEVLSRIDDVMVFHSLRGLDVARVAALEIESAIRKFGLEISGGGIDPDLLWKIMERQQKIGESASSRDLIRSIEKAIGPSLAAAREAGAKQVSITADEHGSFSATPVRHAAGQTVP